MRDCREYCSEDEGEGGFGELRKKGWGWEGKGSPATSISSSTSTSSNRTSAVSPLEDGPVQGRGRGVIQTWAWGGGGGGAPTWYGKAVIVRAISVCRRQGNHRNLHCQRNFTRGSTPFFHFHW